MTKSQYAPSPEDCDLVHEMHQYADDILSVREQCFYDYDVIVCTNCGVTLPFVGSPFCEVCSFPEENNIPLDEY